MTSVFNPTSPHCLGLLNLHLEDMFYFRAHGSEDVGGIVQFVGETPKHNGIFFRLSDKFPREKLAWNQIAELATF